MTKETGLQQAVGFVLKLCSGSCRSGGCAIGASRASGSHPLPACSMWSAGCLLPVPAALTARATWLLSH